ncbi:anthranilate 1,2-dioxygenase regulatory protein AndR [Paraburkholderia fungorum]|uniref:anthranilate 1,2-dioxygenase regulatory protein AndR n=1 Tax=Paraburkholderia fungorum TaxID=134537 RepID=UPI0038B872D3
MTPFAFRADALRAYRLFESNDLDETRERISRVMQPHLLVPAGSRVGRSHMDFVKLGGLGLGTIAFGSAMRVNVEAVDGYHLMMFCVAGHAKVRVKRDIVHVDQDNGILCAPGHPFDAVLSPDCEQFVLRIDPAALSLYTGSSKSVFAPHVRIDSQLLRSWLQQLHLVASSPDLLESARNNPRVATQLECLLLELLASGHAKMEGDVGRSRLSPFFIKRVEEFINESSAEPLRLADIANAVGLPERTLRDGFQKFHGTSPMQYLRQVRLERAREALRNAPLDARVSDIALDCGFMHLGRFAIEYRNKFGESPSETLRDR